jgi:hypothetical protein
MSEWSFRYLDSRQTPRQSRQFATKEVALKEACSYNRAGNSVTSLDGPGVRLNGADVAAWCARKLEDRLEGLPSSRGLESGSE